MNTESVRTNLRYDRADLETLFMYAKVHDVGLDGRYDLRTPPYLNIWTHTWTNPGCKAESSLMFTLKFDRDAALLSSVLLQTGYDWQAFLDELARLEEAALANTVYGKHVSRHPQRLS
jgi:hypothetical protein